MLWFVYVDAGLRRNADDDPPDARIVEAADHPAAAIEAADPTGVLRRLGSAFYVVPFHDSAAYGSAERIRKWTP